MTPIEALIQHDELMTSMAHFRQNQGSVPWMFFFLHADSRMVQVTVPDKLSGQAVQTYIETLAAHKSAVYVLEVREEISNTKTAEGLCVEPFSVDVLRVSIKGPQVYRTATAVIHSDGGLSPYTVTDRIGRPPTH